MTDKIKIAPTIKEMALFQTIVFPLEYYATVNATIQRIKNETDMIFTQRKISWRNEVEVTRLK